MAKLSPLRLMLVRAGEFLAKHIVLNSLKTPVIQYTSNLERLPKPLSLKYFNSVATELPTYLMQARY